MSWPTWAKVNEKALAGYAVRGTASSIRLTSSTTDVLAGGDRLSVIRELYETLARMDIRWSRELYTPDEAQQEIRPPEAILRGAGDGTCLDLALLMAGAALGKELLPVVVVLDGHALLAVSTRTERRDADSFARQAVDGGLFTAGVADGDSALARLRALVDAKDYVLVECTGFARSGVLDETTPEGKGRVDGLMDFARATAAGREQLDFAHRPFAFAVDVAYLQDVGRVEQYLPHEASLELANTELRDRHRTLLEYHGIVAGRDPELDRLDTFLDEDDSGYLLVTGVPGTGKTALLAEWLRRLGSRRGVRLVYHFISRQHGTADRQFDFMQSLVQQATWAWDRRSRAIDTISHLEGAWLNLLDAGSPPPEPVVILIDGADECDGWSLNRTLFPAHLPHGVHVVVSARSVAGMDWRTTLGLGDAQTLELTGLEDDAVRAVLRRLSAPSWLQEPAAFEILSSKARGDPFYVRVLTEDVEAGQIRTVDDLARAPTGLRTYVDSWWDDVKHTAAEPAVACLISYLTVAVAPITRADLVDIEDDDALSGLSFDAAMEQLERYLAGEPAVAGIAFAHWRLKDFISSSVLTDREVQRARAKMLAWCDRWQEHRSRYALAKGVTHHLAAADEGLEDDRRARRRAVVDLVRQHDYQKLRVEAGDAAGLIADLVKLTGLLCTGERPDVGSVVVMAMELTDARARWLQPSTVFELASSGQWEEAVVRLDLLPAPDTWRTAGELCIAWIAAGLGVEDAARLLDVDTSGSPALTMLADRARRAFAGDDSLPGWGAFDQSLLGSLLDEASAVVDHLVGDDANAEGLGPAHGYPATTSRPFVGAHTPTGDEDWGLPTFASADARVLVHAAEVAPGPGGALLEEYIRLQRGNPYSDYRNRTLDALLSEILTLSHGYTARTNAVKAVEAALNPSPVRFSELLELSAFRRESLGDLGELDLDLEEEARGRLADARAAAGNLPVDMWSFRRRSLAAHAETLAGLGEEVLAEELLDAALEIESGFAGFRVPALMALADANFVVRPDDPAAQARALAAAMEAAHNIQDPSFCARSTAYVNDRMSRHTAGPLDGPAVTHLVEAFVDSRARAFEFGSRFEVGEQFVRRQRWDHVAVDFVTDADTLEVLATTVLQLPVSHLEAANPGMTRTELLGAGTPVQVPDPTYLPLFAAWLSANVVAAMLPDAEKARLVAGLVPAAMSNPTALDTVLGRLVTVAPEVDLDDVDDVLHLAVTLEPEGVGEYPSSRAVY